MRDPGYHPFHSYLERGSARPARVRRQTAGRMRDLRARQRETGRPDPAALDRAIVDAFRDAIAGSVRGGATRWDIDPMGLVLGIAEHLRARSERAILAGKVGIVYQREAVAEAIHLRLLAPKA
ncbi:hypothetical protein MKK68_24585 [Methylobacterium sp. E-016]|uniref:hypothetical protein n=1 Tax=Methylobacterium sp. E-016 TaxID=2836556 RepID=UPI001FBA99BD|nr:hypothetical protein [Methylobacterium sp. E-016]MCJ2078779.1 hypothetical protein [Methylobacterium sp. E-016]